MPRTSVSARQGLAGPSGVPPYTVLFPRSASSSTSQRGLKSPSITRGLHTASAAEPEGPGAGARSEHALAEQVPAPLCANKLVGPGDWFMCPEGLCAQGSWGAACQGLWLVSRSLSRGANGLPVYTTEAWNGNFRQTCHTHSSASPRDSCGNPERSE